MLKDSKGPTQENPPSRSSKRPLNHSSDTLETEGVRRVGLRTAETLKGERKQTPGCQRETLPWAGSPSQSFISIICTHPGLVVLSFFCCCWFFFLVRQDDERERLCAQPSGGLILDAACEIYCAFDTFVFSFPQ